MPVNTVGYLVGKAHGNDDSCDGLSFFFITRGRGLYWINNRRFAIDAPTLFVRYPGVRVKYSPHCEWDELYIYYDAKLLPVFQRQGLLPNNRMVWRIHNPVHFQSVFNRLSAFCREAHQAGGPDRIDRTCEALIEEAMLGSLRRHIPDKNEMAVRAIHSFLEAHVGEEIDFNKLAQRQGLSPPHFRRLWHRYFDLSPGRYLMHLRMQEACRLLVETKLRVNEISAQLRFQNPLHFSARFRQWIGQPATQYRLRHQKHP